MTISGPASHQLRADQLGHDPAGDEEERGRGDVEDPDPLVVDGDEPARHLAPLPLRDERCSVSALAAKASPSDRRRGRRAAPVLQSRPTGGIWPLPFLSSVARKASFWIVPELAICGPTSPCPARPWHLRAGAGPLLLAERVRGGAVRLLRRSLRDPLLELPARQYLDRHQHVGVLDAAELRAAALEGPRLRRREPRVVEPSRDRVDLSAEGRDPPRVDDVPVRRGHGRGAPARRPGRGAGRSRRRRSGT